MKEIIIVFDQPSWGGADSHLIYLLQDWPNKSDKIYIYFNSYNKGIIRVKRGLENYKNIFFVEYNHPIINIFEFFNKIKYIRILNFFFIPLRFMIMKKFFKKIFKRKKFDCLLALNGGYPGSYGCLAAVIEAKKIELKSINMVVYHCAKKPMNFYQNFRSKLDKDIAESLDNLISISQATLDTIKECTKIFNYLKDSQSKIINCGIKIDTNPIAKIDLSSKFKFKNRKLIGILGRIQKYKGQEDLIMAYKELPDYYKDKINLAIIGRGDKKNTDDIKNFIKINKIEESIKLLGFLNEDSNVIMNSLDLLVFATRNWDGWSLVAAEAMSVGVPVISTRVGATTEFINNDNGYLIDPNSVQDMKKAFIDFIDNYQQWEKRAVFAKNDIKKYDAKIFSKIYRETIIKLG
jgi:glycosyltransferase involved in cell wall biosynthesis